MVEQLRPSHARTALAGEGVVEHKHAAAALMPGVADGALVDDARGLHLAAGAGAVLSPGERHDADGLHLLAGGVERFHHGVLTVRVRDDEKLQLVWGALVLARRMTRWLRLVSATTS